MIRSGRAFGLRRSLSARLGPVASLVLAVVCVSAPVAYLVMGARTVRTRAAASAEYLAEVLRAEIQEQPRLWKYNTLKILPHLRAHTAQGSIQRIEVTDARGIPIELGLDAEPAERGELVWASAPVRMGGGDRHVVAQVWVGATLRDVQSQALWLLFGFCLLGAGLAGLTYWLPMRAIGAAERRIGSLVHRLSESRKQLEALNASLEHQVDERSSQLLDKEQRLRELSGRAIALQEAERRDLSRELHDSAGQALTAIRINLQLIAERSRDADVRHLAQRTLQSADATLEDIRRVVDRLGPSILDDMGLAAAVERYCDDFSERAGASVDCKVDCPARLESAVETACYRMVQEALTNVSRHANASRVELSLKATGSELELTIADDGAGFDVDQALARDRRGLTGMRERVELLGGVFELRSEVGCGARVSVRLPLDARN